MRQVLQSLKTGEVELAEIPVPTPGSGQVLIQSTFSLVSLGTEKMLLEFGQAGWLGKAQQQPDKVKQVLQKISNDGLMPTLKAVQNKLDRPIPLGYCNVGRVIAIGSDVNEFSIGDRVVSNGNHAEIVCINKNLVAKIPESVSDQDAAFTFVAAIGIQGVRLLEPSLGETIVVLGLGLIGLLSVQILRANGCQVIGFDYDQKKVDLANKFGARAFQIREGSDPVSLVNELTKNIGCDGVLITASTQSSDPVRMAPQMCRQRGRVSLVGVCDLDLSREDFYKKEISFQVSCSYGPGRYDPIYEQKNYDYPIGFVRWTEQRNIQAVLQLMVENKIQCHDLISAIANFSDAPSVYKDQLHQKDLLGLLFKYPDSVNHSRTTHLKLAPEKSMAPVSQSTSRSSQLNIGIIGAGQFIGSTILPILKSQNCNLISICSKNGVSAQQLGKKYDFNQVTTDLESMFTSQDCNVILIATPHAQHGAQALRALKSGKHTFLEKPLAMTTDEVNQIERELKQQPNVHFMVGFNRRFSPLIEPIKKWLGPSPSGASFVMNVNAGAVDKSHWTQDKEVGGGRLIGECCHFIDLLRYLGDTPIAEATCCFADTPLRDTFSIHLKFKSGSIGVINYFANGHKALAKERLEVFFQNQVVIMDNFKSIKTYGAKGVNNVRKFNQDKGHKQQFELFFAAIKQGGAPIIPYSELIEVARLCILLETGKT